MNDSSNLINVVYRDAFEAQRMVAPIVMPVKDNTDLSNFEEYPGIVHSLLSLAYHIIWFYLILCMV
jgi:hypothetical protein